jgi:RNA polymerase sigma-70 factor (ECF subfamily)
VDHDLTRTLDLVQKAQGGDRVAMDALFDRYYERVRRAVRARIGSRLRTHLETCDILQAAFAKAFENFDRFEMRGEGSLLHWLAEYAHGQIRDAADKLNAKKRRAPVAPQTPSGFAGDPPAAGATSPSECAVAREHQVAVDECVAELDEPYRRVIVLRDYDGLAWADVARALGKATESAARGLHTRARLQLVHRLELRGIRPEA